MMLAGLLLFYWQNTEFLSSPQHFMASRPDWIFAGCVVTNLRSSAYPKALHTFTRFGKSFTYIMKNRGPNSTHCGTTANWDNFGFSFNYLNLLFSFDEAAFDYFQKLTTDTQLLNFCEKFIVCHTVERFLKCKYSTNNSFFSSSYLYERSRKSSSCVTNDLYLLKPCCELSRDDLKIS